ncbi:MAG: hypothetical protein JNL98_23875 [Bryobacterales bacterium]|nr:hypothetical protein [Bryobacterales bacterium]
MAGQGGQTFKKRQKEQQRKEKQQEKLAKRLQKKQDKKDGDGGPEIDWDYQANADLDGADTDSRPHSN